MREQVLLALLEALGKVVHSKKAFQKLVYFLQRLEVPLGFQYALHFYGPYSAELAHSVRAMEMAGLVKLTDNGGAVEIALTHDSPAFLRQEGNSRPGFAAGIQFVASSLGKCRPWELELLSTGDFLVAQAGINDMDKLMECIEAVKEGKFDVGSARRAMDKLISLGFLEIGADGRLSAVQPTVHGLPTSDSRRPRCLA